MINNRTVSITRNGKPLDKSKYSIDLKNKTFSSAEHSLVLDFGNKSGWTFNIGHHCTVKVGKDCIFNTLHSCQFSVSTGCIFNVGEGGIISYSIECMVYPNDDYNIITISRYSNVNIINKPSYVRYDEVITIGGNSELLLSTKSDIPLLAKYSKMRLGLK